MRRLIVGLAILVMPPALRAQARVEWPTYAGDAAATKYSPLDDVNRRNVRRLTIAWRWAVAEQPIRHLLEDVQRRLKPRLAEGNRRLPAYLVVVDECTGHMTAADVDGDAQH